MKVFGLIGYPLGHSFSKAYFSRKFSEENHNAIYKNFEISSLSELSRVLETEPGLAGLNVTIPYKSEILAYLDKVDPLAAEIGAVNVVSVLRKDSGIKLSGYNTDIIGFRDSLIPLLKPGLSSALVLGSGGASLAVRKCLNDMGINYLLVSRSAETGDLLYKDLNREVIKSYPLIINTTPLGMFPDIQEYPDIPYKYLGKNNILYDLVYNPELTGFLSLGKDRGCTVKGGKEMLHLQAEAAWTLWNKH